MRTEDEVKKFIDDREALTVTELSYFIYKNRKGANKRIRRWWGYVLDTKNWVKLREYKEKKMAGCDNGKRLMTVDEFSEIYKKDPRFQGKGYRAIFSLLKKAYNFPGSCSTVHRLYNNMKVLNGVIN